MSPDRRVPEVERPEAASHELDDRMPHGIEHAPHDPVATGVQRQLHHRVPVVALLLQHAGAIGRG